MCKVNEGNNLHTKRIYIIYNLKRYGLTFVIKQLFKTFIKIYNHEKIT